jgi:hypothetical protein
MKMVTNQLAFFKGLQGFTRQSDALLARDAKESVYFWWWEFMRLSPVFWYARQTGLPIKHPEMAATYALAGDLSRDNFYGWWRDTGCNVFVEAKRPASVQTLLLDDLPQHEFFENGLLLEIPLTIRKETIIAQVKRLLNQYHSGRGLDLAGTTTAKLRLHTKRYRLRTLETEYWVLLYRLLYSDIETWRIGDRLQISPSLKVRGIERGEFNMGRNPFDMLHSLTGRYLYKARHTIVHVQQGRFPDATKVEPAVAPFGKKLDADFVAATKSCDKEPSEWQKWLQAEYHDSLVARIARSNRIDSALRLPGSKLKQRLPAFISGKSDELN